MDTITHGFLGAAVAQSVLTRRLPRGAGLIGAIGGMAPDLDILIYSLKDPTVSWSFHRNFSHSLIFIPLGGLLVALLFLFRKQFKDYKKEVALAAIISYATHCLLDSATSYGTQLFWPFANTRVAWDWTPIVDPVYSIPLLIGAIWSARTRNAKAARMALIISTLYLSFGVWQHHRAVEAQHVLAAMRGHNIEYTRVMPAPGWLMFWRSLYVTKGQLYVDGVETRWFGGARAVEGGSARLATINDLPLNALSNAESRRRFEVLNWFTGGLISPVEAAERDQKAYGDMRFTAAVESLTPLWGLQFDLVSGDSERWNPPPSARREFGGLIKALVFGDARYKSLSELRKMNSR